MSSPTLPPTSTSIPKPTLLTLPLEIRTQIYTHLTHPITLPWLWRVSILSGTPSYIPDIVHTRIPHAPLCSVMLVCRVVRAEYSAMRCFRSGDVKFRVGDGGGEGNWDGESKNEGTSKGGKEWSTQKNLAALKYLASVGRVGLRMSVEADDLTGTQRGVWREIEEFVGAVRCVAPCLKSIVIVLKQDCTQLVTQDTMSMFLRLQNSDSRASFAGAPEYLDGLKMREVTERSEFKPRAFRRKVKGVGEGMLNFDVGWCGRHEVLLTCVRVMEFEVLVE